MGSRMKKNPVSNRTKIDRGRLPTSPLGIEKISASSAGSKELSMEGDRWEK